MTSKEAKKILNEYRNRNYNSALEEEVELAMAIDAVLPKYVKLEERDTPKNIVLKAGSFFNISIICPSCDFPINTERHELHSSTMFCERCGQKINLAQRV